MQKRVLLFVAFATLFLFATIGIKAQQTRFGTAQIPAANVRKAKTHTFQYPKQKYLVVVQTFWMPRSEIEQHNPCNWQ